MTMQAPAPPAHPPAAPPAAAPPPAPGAATGAGPVAALTQASQKLQAVLAAAQAAGGALPPTAASELAAVVQAIQGATGGGAPPAASGAPPAPPKPPAPPGAGGPPPGIGKADTMTTVKMDKAGFAAWTQKQFEAMKTDTEEVAKARLATVKHVTAIAKASWEDSAGSPDTEPFEVEMSTAFAPEPEKSQDLTTKDDQDEEESPVGKDTPDESGSFATNLAEVIKDVQSALDMPEQPEKGSTVAFSNPDAPARTDQQKSDKAKTEKADEPFVWPLDMNDPDAGKSFDAPDPKASRPTEGTDGWGKDPWGK